MWGKDLVENCQKMLKKAIFVEVSSNSGKESGINNQQKSYSDVCRNVTILCVFESNLGGFRLWSRTTEECKKCHF